MDRDRFEAEVFALAADGVKLTVANVAARTRLSPRETEEGLDAMVAAHRLDSEIDESQGFVFYSVRGLDADAARNRLAILELEVHAESAARDRLATRSARPAAIERHREKSVVGGVILAVVFGPLGLLYAGPAEEVAVYFITFLAASFLGGIPILGFLAQGLAGFLWLASIALQIIYVSRYNANGQRTGLVKRAPAPRLLGR
jgi:hypothetical protein